MCRGERREYVGNKRRIKIRGCGHKYVITITHHQLVPKHTKLSESEKEKLFKEQKLSIRDLPKILKTDSAIMKLSVKSGDVIKIERTSRTAGIAIYYRGVIDG